MDAVIQDKTIMPQHQGGVNHIAHATPMPEGPMAANMQQLSKDLKEYEEHKDELLTLLNHNPDYEDFVRSIL